MTTWNQDDLAGAVAGAIPDLVTALTNIGKQMQAANMLRVLDAEAKSDGTHQGAQDRDAIRVLVGLPKRML